jgi:hypothetical protein
MSSDDHSKDSAGKLLESAGVLHRDRGFFHHGAQCYALRRLLLALFSSRMDPIRDSSLAYRKLDHTSHLWLGLGQSVAWMRMNHQISLVQPTFFSKIHHTGFIPAKIMFTEAA